MKDKSFNENNKSIIEQLKDKYPNCKSFDMYGDGKHLVCELEPTKDHPEYDRAIEVIFKSKPHKHLKMNQQYTIISGKLRLHLDDRIIELAQGDVYNVLPNIVHWAESEEGCWAELYSQPGWTKEDHIQINVDNSK